MNKIVSILLLGVFPLLNAQVLPDLMPKTPNASQFTNYSKNNFGSPTISPLNTTNQNVRNQLLIAEVERNQQEQQMREKQAQALINDALHSFPETYSLPSYGNEEGANYYRKAFEKLRNMSSADFSVKKAIFAIENAFYEETENYDEFENTIKQTGDFLREKMNELGYDSKSNLAKNFLLFQFFSDTLKIKSKNLKHLPLTYDFEDYMGKDDWSKMFVKKLLETGKGQCNSLPQLYLILAEEIGAEANLALSPNHSYIKFQDDEKWKWYNVELTNGMLTTDAFILQSGYVKAEALQNKVYMHPLSKQQLQSHLYMNLALGYIGKYGYDEFVNEIISKALELNPSNVQAYLIKSNYTTIKVKYALDRLGIGKENFDEIKQHPRAIQLYKNMIAQYNMVDKLGHQEMPPDEYQRWLASVKEESNKQQNIQLKTKLNTIIPVKQ
ncbi:hypothetical protein [Aquimarina algiphila]|uniref:Protein SirB1 N-terminal domain-containing protein n=1 Tax=Aquimarina algiphila TaxID=2047982 RepID=A0A554VJ39_9FLAO|nr:hypothetical protein [Aquimarina algiphila]TSE07887.1 hypothetical protein FOF46_14265 [Aquimarina algiphila]